jgi:hypothetical protein
MLLAFEMQWNGARRALFFFDVRTSFHSMGNGRETELWVPRAISGSTLSASVIRKYCILSMQKVCVCVYEREYCVCPASFIATIPPVSRTIRNPIGYFSSTLIHNSMHLAPRSFQ